MNINQKINFKGNMQVVFGYGISDYPEEKYYPFANIIKRDYRKKERSPDLIQALYEPDKLHVKTQFGTNYIGHNQ